MLLSHIPLTSLNMSYGAIWTHFRPNFIFFGPNKSQILVKKSEIFLSFPKQRLRGGVLTWYVKNRVALPGSGRATKCAPDEGIRRSTRSDLAAKSA